MCMRFIFVILILIFVARIDYKNILQRKFPDFGYVITKLPIKMISMLCSLLPYLLSIMYLGF